MDWKPRKRVKPQPEKKTRPPIISQAEVIEGLLKILDTTPLELRGLTVRGVGPPLSVYYAVHIPASYDYAPQSIIHECLVRAQGPALVALHLKPGNQQVLRTLKNHFVSLKADPRTPQSVLQDMADFLNNFVKNPLNYAVAQIVIATPELSQNGEIGFALSHPSLHDVLGESRLPACLVVDLSGTKKGVIAPVIPPPYPKPDELAIVFAQGVGGVINFGSVSNARHYLIGGATGKGKSTTVKVILREMLDYTTWVLDAKGEYGGETGIWGIPVWRLTEANYTLGAVTFYKASLGKLSEDDLRTVALQESQLAALTFKAAGYAQASNLASRFYDIIMGYLNEGRSDPFRAAEKIGQALEKKFALGPYKALLCAPAKKTESFLTKGLHKAIIDVSALLSLTATEEERDAAIAWGVFLPLMTVERVQYPAVLFAEESHRLTPLFAEGLVRLARAFGVAVVFITQRPLENKVIIENISGALLLGPGVPMVKGILEVWGHTLPEVPTERIPTQLGEGLLLVPQGDMWPFKVVVTQETLAVIKRFEERVRK